MWWVLEPEKSDTEAVVFSSSIPCSSDRLALANFLHSTRIRGGHEGNSGTIDLHLASNKLYMIFTDFDIDENCGGPHRSAVPPQQQPCV